MAKCMTCGETVAWRKDGTRWTTTEPQRDEQGAVLFDERAHALPTDTPHACHVKVERPRGQSKCKECGAHVVWQPVYIRQHATFTRRAWRMVDAGTSETHRCEERLIPCRVVDEQAYKVAR